MKLTRPLLATLLLMTQTALCGAAPPQSVPTRLPTSPAEVIELLAQTDAAEARMKELAAQRNPARNALAQALAALRNGPFKAANGLKDPEFKRLSATVADLDTQMRRKITTTDNDELAALTIENQRLRARKDAVQATLDQFMVNCCLSSPEAKAVQDKMHAMAQLERDIENYGEILANWRDVAGGYRQRQIPDGFDLKTTRELTLPPPADAEQRRAEFARRNDAAHVESLAHRLFRSLDENAHGLAESFALYREKKFAAALDAFRDYFFDKLAHLEKYGVSADAVLTEQRPPLGTPLIKPEWVADAMRGVATQPNRNVSSQELLKITVGEPGAVNWGYTPFEPMTPRKMPLWLQVMRQFHILEHVVIDWTDGLRSWLIDAYQVTGEAKYLRRWAEYADDWALNMQRDLNALPVGNVAPAGFDPAAIRMDARNAPYCWNVRWYPTLIAGQLPQFVTRLRAVALTHPEIARDFPATTLARVLLAGLDEYLAPNILVARATRFNWNIMGLELQRAHRDAARRVQAGAVAGP